MIRVGVIGLGIGRSHIKGYQDHPDAQIVAIADLNPKALEETGREYGIESRYTSHTEMLAKEKLDVVSIALPNYLHKSVTLEALAAGCHVLCEKPMAMNAAEAREMLDAARRAGKRLMINFSFRFRDQSWALKRQIETGILGDVYFARSVWHRRRGLPGFGGWFGQKQYSGGGALIDLGVHRLDLALWFMGYPKPSYILGSAYNPIGTARALSEQRPFDVDDLAAACIKFENGATLMLEASWAANIAEKEYMETRLYGTRAGLVQKNKNEGYEFEAEIFIEQAGCQFDMKLHDSIPVTQANTAMYHFVDAIINDRPHIAAGDEGLVVMEILDAIYESAQSGKPVDVAARRSAATAG
ncbi:MAG TPA: Gfo/Idh/MocA family oxidoreductase [Spirochaetia bacterium]|nr:Gfo/Idh/MocA family oxidoreductase [Spirochaetia bacterium]